MTKFLIASRTVGVEYQVVETADVESLREATNRLPVNGAAFNWNDCLQVGHSTGQTIIRPLEDGEDALKAAEAILAGR